MGRSSPPDGVWSFSSVPAQRVRDEAEEAAKLREEAEVARMERFFGLRSVPGGCAVLQVAGEQSFHMAQMSQQLLPHAFGCRERFATGCERHLNVGNDDLTVLHQNEGRTQRVLGEVRVLEESDDVATKPLHRLSEELDLLARVGPAVGEVAGMEDQRPVDVVVEAGVVRLADETISPQKRARRPRSARLQGVTAQGVPRQSSGLRIGRSQIPL